MASAVSLLPHSWGDCPISGCTVCVGIFLPWLRVSGLDKIGYSNRRCSGVERSEEKNREWLLSSLTAPLTPRVAPSRVCALHSSTPRRPPNDQKGRLPLANWRTMNSSRDAHHVNGKKGLSMPPRSGTIRITPDHCRLWQLPTHAARVWGLPVAGLGSKGSSGKHDLQIRPEQLYNEQLVGMPGHIYISVRSFYTHIWSPRGNDNTECIQIIYSCRD